MSRVDNKLVIKAIYENDYIPLFKYYLQNDEITFEFLLEIAKDFTLHENTNYSVLIELSKYKDYFTDRHKELLFILLKMNIESEENVRFMFFLQTMIEQLSSKYLALFLSEELISEQDKKAFTKLCFQTFNRSEEFFDFVQNLPKHCPIYYPERFVLTNSDLQRLFSYTPNLSIDFYKIGMIKDCSTSTSFFIEYLYEHKLLEKELLQTIVKELSLEDDLFFFGRFNISQTKFQKNITYIQNILFEQKSKDEKVLLKNTFDKLTYIVEYSNKRKSQYKKI